jgi:outer membrane protein assembly factor BamB
LPVEPTVLNRDIEGAVLVFENNLGKPGKRLRSSVDLAFNYLSLEGDDNLYCVNAAGRIIWKYQIPGGLYDFKTSLEGKYVAIASSSGGMFFLDNTGKLLWSYSLGRAIPSHDVSPDGSIVVATTIPPSGKGHTLCILSRSGQVVRHLSIPYEIVSMGISFDGNVVLVGDLNQNVAQYSRTGDRQWIYSIRAPVQEITVSQSGLLIFALTSEIISISPSGTERWRIRLPDGPVSLLRMSHDGSVNAACGSGALFRYDLKGKLLWKHPIPARKANFLLSYRSFNIVLFLPAGIEYWDKYGFAISTFQLPAAEHTNEECFSISQDGRYILYLDDIGVLRQVDVGKVLAQHLISASKIFLEELHRLGTVSQGAEENLQWAMESMNDGDVQYALSFGSQAYSSMETTLDSLPARRGGPESKVVPLATASEPTVTAPSATKAAPRPGTGNASELYKKGLREIFSAKDEPSEIEWNLLGILREAFSISPEEHDAFEETVKSELKATRKAPAAVSPKPEPLPSEGPEIHLDELQKPLAEEKEADIEEVETFTVEPEGEKEAGSIQPPVAKGPEPYRPPQVERFEPARPSIPPAEKVEPVPPAVPAAAQPAGPPKPVEGQANFNMDNYVSDILSKYLKK